ncbi:hypothetical protein [Superficieibacter sp. HKU1]|uniref:hypothetical protein n=1 Tax=Superficieibacter sp. HKU1 TaxID=3031919 RepID=UPI0023E10784|nr:hypothetical protein [Superficieibacter sp. HKU1]WES70783.1 hypothetical protein P0H77_06685 [Superficieibacter sp. HKU1]
MKPEHLALLRDKLWRLNHLYWITDKEGRPVRFSMTPEQMRGRRASVKGIVAGWKKSAGWMLVRRMAVRSEVRSEKCAKFGMLWKD